MLYVHKIVVSATFIDFQANIFPLFFKPRVGKFPVQEFRTWCFYLYSLFFDLFLVFGSMGYFIFYFGGGVSY